MHWYQKDIEYIFKELRSFRQGLSEDEVRKRQEQYGAEKAMAALKEMAAPTATVLRAGKTADIPSSELVPGDIVTFEAGKIVPAV